MQILKCWVTGSTYKLHESLLHIPHYLHVTHMHALAVTEVFHNFVWMHINPICIQLLVDYALVKHAEQFAHCSDMVSERCCVFFSVFLLGNSFCFVP